MNYKESKKILTEIKKAKRILLMCHTSPDEDSIVSCLILQKALIKLGAKVDIVSPDKLEKHQSDLDHESKVIFCKPDNIKFNNYDLFFLLDVSGLKRLGIGFKLPTSLKIINIDHHDSEEDFTIKIKDHLKSSTSEIIYQLVKDFGYKLSLLEKNLILIGIISDTDSFQYGYFPSTFRTVADLIEQGADYDKALVYLWRSFPIIRFKFISEMLSRIKLDNDYNFAYSAIPYKEYKKFEKLNSCTRDIADHFIRNIDNTNFGIVMVESTQNNLKVSVRSRRENFRVLDIVEELGGGGYIGGGGALITGLSFEEAVKKVLLIARKYAKNR